MSERKATVERYIHGFNASDHAEVLACLTDDVEWVLPGAYHLRGKAAFDAEIENDAFTGRPTVTVTRMVEEGEVVVAEGNVKAQRKDGPPLDAVFCDVFVFEGPLIRQVTSYLLALS